MTPYTKKIVELHKIHKAIEEKDCCNGGGNTPSGDITIDDVVKFIHDESEGQFPYTTWNDIPNIDDVDVNEFCKRYNVDSGFDDSGFNVIILNINPYIIGLKGGEPIIQPT